MEYRHVPVMVKEVLFYLNCKPGDVIVDATVGGGGHAESILKMIGSSGKLIGIDKDGTALLEAEKRLASYRSQLVLVKADFKEIRQTLLSLGFREVDGVLFDSGVSSLQLDDAKRGFSYNVEGPLDMRMNQEGPLTAEKVVNTYSRSELAQVIKRYGEERWGDRIASFIVETRRRKPIKTTLELVDVIKAAIPAAARRRGGHPARRTFQAIRIEVNDELKSLEIALREAIGSLKMKGRITTISYHSLEDRIVKRIFKEESLPEFGARLMILTKRPVRPSSEEIAVNPRSESAKLRAAEKL
ncbi:MAG: 16S rRNA (cytosine(1402)-N(4))-methyltransferase RsmH [Actinomycetota bacterium]